MGIYKQMVVKCEQAFPTAIFYVFMAVRIPILFVRHSRIVSGYTWFKIGTENLINQRNLVWGIYSNTTHTHAIYLHV